MSAAVETLIYDVIETPIGRLIVASDGAAIAATWMANASPDDERWQEQQVCSCRLPKPLWRDTIDACVGECRALA